MYIDTHTHLSKADYDNIDMVIKRANDNNVKKLIVSCCTKKDIIEGIELSKKHKDVYLTIGFHPSESVDLIESDIIWLSKIIKSNKKIVGIGEIGLDYHYDINNRDAQILWFKKQLELAAHLKKPVLIHTRDATQDTIEILKNCNLKGIIHCFTGSLNVAEQYIKFGYYIGIGGVLTFKNANLAKVVKDIPLENIVLETDSPYLSPDPYRGEKNEPKNIPIIAMKLSEIKGIKVEEVELKTYKNALRLFDLIP